MSRAVFLDRDGVINEMVPSSEGPDSPRSVDEFKLLSGAAAAVRMLNRLGLPVVVISNQPGVAKEKFPAANLDEMTKRMTEALRDDQAELQGIYYCMHHPEAVVDAYRKSCDCRKPKPGLLVQAAKDMNLTLAGSYMVGDQPKDIAAGKSVGCTTMLIGTGSPRQQADADYACSDLKAAARLIVELESAAHPVAPDPSIHGGHNWEVPGSDTKGLRIPSRSNSTTTEQIGETD
jgi:D-glycero-D-manno-heptose 1,7-bisphosphate phosphatase